MAAATAILAVGAVIGAAASGYSAYEQNKVAKKQEKMEKDQARMELDAAHTEAGNIRENARRVKAAQRAALAGSGVKLDDEGTGAALLAETDRLAEQDALAVLKEGANRSSLLRGQASISRSRGRQAIAAGVGDVAAGAVNAYGANRSASSGSRTALQMDSDAQGFARRSQPKYSLLTGNKSGL